jgi:hypothetical protein
VNKHVVPSSVRIGDRTCTRAEGLQHRAQLRLESEVVGGAVDVVERGCLLGPTAHRDLAAHRRHLVLP